MHLASNVVVICTFIDLWALPQVTSKVCRALFISFSFSLSQRAHKSRGREAYLGERYRHGRGPQCQVEPADTQWFALLLRHDKYLCHETNHFINPMPD